MALPWIEGSGAEVLASYFSELTVHTWDLATATGQQPDWDDTVVAAAFDAARRILPMSYKTSYTVAMADTITFRPDEDTAKALEVLTRDGTTVSAAVRSALIDAARRKADAAIRAEAERLAEDESDRAEAMQVLRDMETLRAW
nr:hypothetical protein [Mycobacterium sp. URHB0044]